MKLRTKQLLCGTFLASSISVGAEVMLFDDNWAAEWSPGWNVHRQTANVHSGEYALQNTDNAQFYAEHPGIFLGDDHWLSFDHWSLIPTRKDMHTEPHLGKRYVFSGLTFLLSAAIATALTWTHPNTPDENTIVLLHFDEGSGATTASASGGFVFNVGETYGEWSANPGWSAEPSGYALKAAAGIGDKQSAASSAAQMSLDWSLPALTISFWIRDQAALQQENQLFYLGYGGWRNQQALMGYRPGWSTAARGMFAGVGTMPLWPWTKLTDGAWHHVALVGEYDSGAGETTVRLFIDNVQQDFTIGGVPASEWTFSPKYTSTVTEYWYLLRGCGGEIDEFLVQAGALTDFSNGINPPVPPGGTIVQIR